MVGREPRAADQGGAGVVAGRADPAPPSSTGTEYRAVTLFAADRRLDVALPSSVPLADLRVSLTRLLTVAGFQLNAGRWRLTPVGRAPLEDTETLNSAGILDGEILVVVPFEVQSDIAAAGVVTIVRDRLEDLVEARGAMWTERVSVRFTLWSATAVSTVLLASAVAMHMAAMGEAMQPGAAATAAVIQALVAVLAAVRSEKVCGAIGLVVACGWAAAAGFTLLIRLGVQERPAWTLVAAAASALLLAASCAVIVPSALTHTSALTVFCCGITIFALSVDLGTPTVPGGMAIALGAVIAIGVLPRTALMLSGLTATDVPCAAGAVDVRIDCADRLLTGMLTGLSALVLAGCGPAVVSGQGGQRLLAAGIGVELLLRSRTLSQNHHLLAPRIAGLLIIAAVIAGWSIGLPLGPALLLPAALVTGVLVLVAVFLVPILSPVSRARAGRLMDQADRLLAVLLVVLCAGSFGLFDAITSFVG